MVLVMMEWKEQGDVFVMKVMLDYVRSNEWCVFIVCDTLQENDRCMPRCVQGKGACDEGNECL